MVRVSAAPAWPMSAWKLSRVGFNRCMGNHKKKVGLEKQKTPQKKAVGKTPTAQPRKFLKCVLLVTGNRGQFKRNIMLTCLASSYINNF